MRILQLKLQGFGPYVAPQHIDFRQLRNVPIFLITGPTGGGKTTLLDAICFALYGETSGGGREVRKIRSDFAAPGHPTEVTLDFSIGPDLYRVHRTPPQSRPKKHGKGEKEEPATATIWCRTAALTESDEGDVLASKPADVTQTAQRLLGFQVDQFRQVVLLPQGDFEKFLAANSKQREDILQVLFQTEKYRRLEEALKQKARSIEDEIARKHDERRTLLQTEDAASEDELRARCDASDLERTQVATAEQTAAKEETAATAALQSARDTQRKLSDLAAAALARQQLAARAPEFTQLRTRLQASRRAAPLVELNATVHTRQTELQTAAQAVTNAAPALDQARLRHASTQSALTAEETRQPQRTAATEHLQRLSDLAPVVRELAAAAQAHAAAKTLHAQIQTECQSAQASIDLLHAQHQQAAEATHAAGLLAATQDGAALQLKALQQERQQRTRHDQAHGELAGAILTRERARNALDTCKQNLETARLHLDQLQSAWLSGQAAVLAASLVAGQPCPVCGSPSHPLPAQPHAGAPDKSKLESQQTRLRKLEKERDTAATALQQAEADATRLQSEFDNLAATLGPRAALSLSIIEAELATAAGRHQQATAAAASLSGRHTLATQRESELAACKSKLATVNQHRESAAQQESASAQSLRTSEARVPEPLRAPGALDRAIQAAQANANQLKNSFDSAQIHAQQASQALAVAGTTHTAAESAQQAATAALQAARETFAQRLQQAGFTTPADYAAAAADVAAADSLDQQVARFDQDLAAATDRLTRAEAAAQGLTAPDLAAHELRLETAKQQLKTLRERHRDLSNLIDRQRKLLKTLQASAAALVRLLADQQAYGRVAQVALGTNPRKVTFQQFVQSTLFDDVLQAASQRLSRMSKGRFDLCRAEEPTDGRSTSGLDILVNDSHSGTKRPVSSFSGGEKFLASLSLALGLADVVQSYAGGIYLESLFIDEGFGALDPESLDHAIATLTELRQTGRSIGIISHVGELKERIPARIEVSTQGGVSTLRVVV